jgi:hypothetical protein
MIRVLAMASRPTGALLIPVALLTGSAAFAFQPGAALAPSATATETALTPDTLATAAKPDGFRYAVLHDVWVESLADTYLYVKANKAAATTTAVPVPRDRGLLAQCIAGGQVDDLVPGTQLAVKFDPRGVVRPEIVVQQASAIEVLDGAKVLDRGPGKLYVLTADGKSRAFAIEGGADAWRQVVANGTPDDLKPGTAIKIDYDPSGREGIRITLRDPPPPGAGKDKGCGCRIGSRGAHWSTGAALLAALACGIVVGRRRVC